MPNRETLLADARARLRAARANVERTGRDLRFAEGATRRVSTRIELAKRAFEAACEREFAILAELDDLVNFDELDEDVDAVADLAMEASHA